MWQPVNFTPPARIAELGKNLAGSLDSFGGSLSRGADNLGGLSLPSLPTPPDITTPLRAGASDMLASQVKFMAIPPYQYGVGSRKGENAYDGLMQWGTSFSLEEYISVPERVENRTPKPGQTAQSSAGEEIGPGDEPEQQ